MAENPVKTLVIDNFRGSMTAYPEGNINSGLSYLINTWGNNPFNNGKYGNLNWVEGGVQIDAAGDVVTDLIMDGKLRLESNIMYVYAIGHTGRLYKIQVNDPTTFNPDYDNPVLLATLTANSPTFNYGGHLEFFGDTERIYISHDKGVTRINLDGTNETFVGVLGSWTQNVPKPLTQFVGKLYVGNGSNIAEIDSTATVTTYTKLSPGFNTGNQVRDMDVSPEGTYLQMIVTQIPLENLFASVQQVNAAANAASYVFKWNGTDTGYTTYKTFPAFTMTAGMMFANYNYIFGYDQYGLALYSNDEKIITITDETSPLPNAILASGNLLTWMAPLFYIDHLEMTYGVFGSADFELSGYWSTFGQLPTGTETDVVQIPWQLSVSNYASGASSNGYTSNIYSKAKIYYSQLETSDTPTTKYKLYKWSPGVPQGDILNGAIYQTQAQLFTKKVLPVAVRIYSEPWVANNSFQIDLIGSAGGITGMSGGVKTFTAGTDMAIGSDYIWWKPQTAPTYVLGLLITNLGTTNFTISKIEIDYVPAGQ